jgi:predicted O-linked N-acetylglucosamine transferase (SPINDLY family)
MPASSATLAAAIRARDAEDWQTARQLYAAALAASPGSPEITLELAICALRTGDAKEALRLCHSVRDPDYRGRAAIITARTLQAAGELDLAADQYESSVQDPQTPLRVRIAAITTLADLMLNQFGNPARAAALFHSVEDSHPAKAQEARLIADMYLGKRRGPALARAFTAHARQFIAAPAPLGRMLRPAPRRRRLRIGLLSPSWFATPVGFLTLGALRPLSQKADLFFFDRRPQTDWLSNELRAVAADWHDVSRDDAAALARTLQQAELDALIDCGGWTDLTALTALSMRPCARQFKWVGGQALTTGLDCFEGLLTDARQVPRSAESLYTEPIKRFADSYVTYTPPPYFDFVEAQQRSLKQRISTRSRVFALVSNPAKISPTTLKFVQTLRPKKLLLIDSRWRFSHTRSHLLPALEGVADSIEYLTPKGHREYLETLRDTAATFIDTRPYSMGLTAIELLLLAKPIEAPRARADALMYERHCLGHLKADRFDHYETQAAQLLQWCKGLESR